MRKMLARSILGVIWITLFPLSSIAAIINYTSHQVTGNQWRYDYEVTATASDPTIEQFTIYFDQDLFKNIVVSASPSNWDSIAIQPDAGLFSDGFFDSLSLGAGITPGSNQGGFQVTFDFSGTGLPMAQRFNIVDPMSFATISSGMTLIAVTPPPSRVPEPAPLMLLAPLSLALLFTRRHQMNR